MAEIDPTASWNIKEQSARIDQMLAETGKLLAEQQKLLAEGIKLQAEARKFKWVDPLLALATLIAALGISHYLAR